MIHATKHRPAALRLEEALAVARLLEVVWPQKIESEEARSGMLRQVDPDRSKALIHVFWDGARPVAAAQTFQRRIHLPEKSLDILALARVCTDPARRGEPRFFQMTRRSLGPIFLPW